MRSFPVLPSIVPFTRFAVVGVVALFASLAFAAEAEVPRALPTPDLFFETNLGQYERDIAYVARGTGYRVVFDAAGARYLVGDAANPHSLRVVTAGGNAPEAIVPSELSPTRTHYFFGEDPSRWVAGAPTWSRLTLPSVYPGIDMVYRAEGPRAEYDFVVAPGADPKRIALAFEGAEAVSIDGEGRLAIHVGGGVLWTAPPVAYQEDGSDRTPVAVAFRRADGDRVGFEVGDYDPSRTLVIDPVVLEYSTRLGGSGTDVATGLAVGSDGSIYVSGRTTSTNFLGTSMMGAGMNDLFVTRLSADGSTALYITYFGGAMSEFPLDLAVNAAGDAFVVLQTDSAITLPNAFDGMVNGMDYLVARFNGAGVLTYGSYYGGAGTDGAFDDGGIALAPNGDVYITGRTEALPANHFVNAYQSAACTAQCAFVAGFDTTQTGAPSLVYGSYVDGDGDDGGQDIAVDSAGRLYVFGFTASDAGLVDVTQGFQPATNDAADQDNFLLKLDTTLSGAAQRVYSTYIGSPQMEAEPRGSVFVESASAVYVTGATAGVASTTPPYAAGFPVKNALNPTPSLNEDAYLAKIDTTTTGNASLVFSTFLGEGTGHHVVTDSAGNIALASDYPADVAPLAEFAGGAGSFLQLDPTGQTVRTATPVPGAFRVAVDAQDRVYVAGSTSATFPEVNPVAGSPAGGSEVFLGRFEALPLTGATLVVEATASQVGVGDDYAYAITLTNNGSVPITDFTVTGGFPSGLSTLFSSLCFVSVGVLTCEPSDPLAFSGSDAIQPNERLTLFGRATSASTGNRDIASLTATTVPADPDPSDNSDGTNVSIVTTPPTTTALEIADFDAFGISSDIGGFAVDTPTGILATGNGVLDETANFMVFDGSMPVYVQDVYSRGRVAFGFVERTTWTPSNGDAISLLDLDGGFGTRDRVYAQITLVGRGPVANVQLRSGDAFSASVAVPGAETQVGLDPGKPFTITLDTVGQLATVTYDGTTILSANPFSTVLSGGADIADVGDDMVISVGGGRLDLGGALLPEPASAWTSVAGLLVVLGLARWRESRQ
ncbi:MAG: SBBP repeat-containing protein [Myxococcota bacterium]